MLSFQEFQKQVLNVFSPSERECKFSKTYSSFSANIDYHGVEWISFQVGYIIDEKDCNCGQWFIRKTYTQDCKTFSDSLTQGIKAIDKQTTKRINNELQVFHKIQEGQKKAVFQEFLSFLEELKKPENK
jgi:hypothetical protein